ncbi:MAG: oligosaccharide flippase family protein [Acidobacteria bacterium]|nr:oligosaccharide flippase family protein [Acidobacteriota bacterium]
MRRMNKIRNPQSAIGRALTIYDKIQKTVKHTLIFSLGSIVNSAFGVLLVPLYTRKLKASEYGVLSLLTITLTLVSIVLKFGLNHAFFRHYYDTEDAAHRRRIVGSTLVFLLVSSLLFTALLYGLAPQLAPLIFKGDGTREGLLKLIFLIGFFEVVNTIPDSILRAKFHSARYSVLNIIAFVFQIAIIAYLVIFVEASARSVLTGRLISAAFETAIFFIAVRRELSLSFSFAELKEMLAFGTPFIFGTIASTLFIMIDRFFLEHYARKGSSEVGVYAMANNLTGVVTMLATMPFAQVWTVMRFKVMNEAGAEEYYSRVLTYILFVSMFLALGVAAVGGDGLLIYALKGYYPVATILPLLALTVVLDSASRVLNVGITLRKRTIYGPLLTLVALGVNVALNFALIPTYGSLGATVATFFSYLLFCGLRYFVSNRFFKVRYEWQRIFTLLGVGTLMVAIFYAMDYLRGAAPQTVTLLLSLSLKTLLALSFPFLLYALRFYDARELHRIHELWQQLVVEIKKRRRREAWLIGLLGVGGIILLGFLLVAARNAHG